MRITDLQAKLIAREIRGCLPDATVYLFGSRVDDQAKGGDIDILVLGQRKLRLDEKLRIKRKFYEAFGEQRIDLISFPEGEQSDFKDLALERSIRLA